MKLIKPSVTIIPQEKGLEGIYRQVELSGRTCYKSENKITEDSAKKFTETMIKSGHGAMLEHGTIYLKIPFLDVDDYVNTKEQCCCLNYDRNKFSFIYYEEPFAYVSTNLRVLVENGWMNDLQYLCEPTEYHKKRVTVKFTCDIGVSREFNRHRVNSMAEQSTRYCNYSKDKFNNELSIIRPEEISESTYNVTNNKWSTLCNNDLSEEDTFKRMCYRIAASNDDNEFEIVDTWMFANLAAQWSYMRLLKLGWKPEQARRVLPLDLQTELVHTAFISDWEHFFTLRCDSHAHPQARELATSLKEEFVKIGLL